MTTFNGNNKIQDFLQEIFSSGETIIQIATELCVDEPEDIYPDFPEMKSLIEEGTVILEQHLLNGKQPESTIQKSVKTIHTSNIKSDGGLFARMIAFSYITNAFWVLYKADSNLQQKYSLTVEETIEINRLITNSSRRTISDSISLNNNSGPESVQGPENTLLIIQLMEGTALCPVSRWFDGGKTGVTLKEILQISKEKRIEHLILEFSGIEEVNERTATGILKIVKALGVLGVFVSLTGIQPGMAQSVVRQNLPFQNLSIYPDIKNAMLKTQHL